MSSMTSHMWVQARKVKDPLKLFSAQVLDWLVRAFVFLTSLLYVPLVCLIVMHKAAALGSQQAGSDLALVLHPFLI